MKTARRYIHWQILKAVLFVTVSFLALFFFFDAINEVSFNTRNPKLQYSTASALTYVAMLMPGHIYELLPIAVLIGTIFVMASMAQSSEFTILRTSGMGPFRALRSLLWLGVAFAMATYLVGDYISPRTEKAAQLYKARFEGNITTGQTGAWVKESLPAGAERVINVRQMTADGEMHQIRIFSFAPDGSLQELLKADSASFGNNAWLIRNAQKDTLATSAQGQALNRQILPQLELKTDIRQDMLASALLEPDRLSIIELYRYITHLRANNQSARNYEIKFWYKLVYPLSCLVMVILALPFGYLHFRSGNISTAVFGGVVVGISFFLLNNVFGYIGNLHAWLPWVAATIPSLFYTLLSLAAFTWLVRKR